MSEALAHTATGPGTPSLRRRLACFVYEGVLLFGVLATAGYLFAGFAQQRHALANRTLLQAFLFFVLAIYFVWFWTHGGQTVAMKTWGIRLLTRDGKTVSQPRAFVRYMLCWLWFLPALAAAWLIGIRSALALFLGAIVGVVVYAAVSRLLPDRQFLHDAVCGTRLVSTP